MLNFNELAIFSRWKHGHVAWHVLISKNYQIGYTYYI